jgi:hypothetical protein
MSPNQILNISFFLSHSLTLSLSHSLSLTHSLSISLTLSLTLFLPPSGGILLFSKEAIIDVCKKAGLHDITSGLIGGFGGGVAQVSVLGPCTFLVTASVTGERTEEVSSASGVVYM